MTGSGCAVRALGSSRLGAFAAALIVCSGFTVSPSLGETRRAFIVGVERYADAKIPPLSRAVADANDLAKDLEETGFERKNIKVVTNAKNKDAFDREFSAFLKTVESGDSVVFFFSGHGFGVEVDKTNYLLLSDLKSPFAFARGKMPEKERKSADVVRLRIPAYLEEYQRSEIPKSGVSLAEIERRLAERNPKNVVVILDACRSLVSAERSESSDAAPLKRGNESGSRLIAHRPPPGFLVLYSASFGEQAVERFGPDDRRRNSLFTEVLRSELLRPGQSLSELAERVKLVVRSIAQKNGHQQEPEYVESEEKPVDFAFLGSIGRERFPLADEKCKWANEDWEQIKQLRSREKFDRHRRAFDQCETGQLARRALAQLAISTEDPVEVPAPVSARAVNECDRLAASELDPARPPEVAGIPFEKVNFEEAIEKCRKAADDNPRVVRYQFNLGRAFHRMAAEPGIDDSKRSHALVQARIAYDNAQKRGYLSALNNLAVLYENGEGADPQEGELVQRIAGNKREASVLLRRAAQQGHPLAMYNLALHYRDGTGGIRRDLGEAYEWLGKSAESGFVSAMIEFGDFLWLGTGRKGNNNPRRAIHWYQRAAEAGSDRAKLKLGLAYFFGRRVAGDGNPNNRVRRDPTLALLWLGRVASTGNSRAQYNLAHMMEEGNGLPNPQPEIAERYWRLAAHGGDGYAQVELAERLRSGFLLTKEEHGSGEAVTHLRRAMSQGLPRAALILAQIYRNGELGEERDPHRAMEFAYQAIELAKLADPTTREGNPFYEIAAAHLLVEMAKNGEIIDAADAFNEHEIERLTRFYGVVDAETRQVKIRRLNVPVRCAVLDRQGKELMGWDIYEWIWVWDWGRAESPTELQFRNIERETSCSHNETLRRTLIEVFEQARKTKLPFADLIDQRIKTAKAAVVEPERGERRRRRR
jgi:TPR repeat protein